MKLAEAFEERPERWGLRGDRYFWGYLEEKAKNTEVFFDADDLEEWVKQEYFNIVKKELDYESIDYVEQFENSGIDGTWWLDKGIPLLKSRLLK